MRPGVLLFAAVTFVSGCVATPSPPAVTAPATGIPATPGPASATASPVLITLPPASLAPAATGFAFDAGDVVDYYRSIGYDCDAPAPSTQAAGYVLTACRLVDPDGRTRLVGIVTDASGRLGNAYAGVWGAAGEDYFDPAAAIGPLAAFLGTMLGAERGGEAAVWLKERLGAGYEATTSGDITIATYTGEDDDPSELYVEVADPAYLAASPPPGT